MNTMTPQHTLLSGPDWIRHFPNQNSINALEPGFQQQVRQFITMLENHGAEIRIHSTLRPRPRVWLMHWAWQIAHGNVPYPHYPGPREEQTFGVTIGIRWDHGDETSSIRHAQAMVAAYDIAYPPSLTSLHITGQAVDMRIYDLPRQLHFSHHGQPITVPVKNNCKDYDNQELHAIGQTFFGVIKHPTDKAHWSVNGE